ncbi:MAG: AzlC family ABC transporter permease, partial [Clostridia bacterium]|nr:AzlC family ABC transporter permease [Clostridia bacterium]
NSRYFLMSLTLSQKLDNSFNTKERFFFSAFITDEIFAVAMQQNKILNIRYMFGLIVCSFAGWLGGTVAGTLVGSVMPIDIVSAMGIAIYAMFIAIIVPPLKKSKPILVVVAIAAVLNCILTYVPALSSLGSSWGVIISGIAAAAIGAVLFPQEMEDFNE